MESEQKRVDIINFMAPLNDATVCRLIDLTHTAQSEGSSEVHLFIFQAVKVQNLRLQAK